MEKKYIKRPLYTERIRPFIGKQLIKVLTGQRRVGRFALTTLTACGGRN